MIYNKLKKNKKFIKNLCLNSCFIKTFCFTFAIQFTTHLIVYL